MHETRSLCWKLEKCSRRVFASICNWLSRATFQPLQSLAYANRVLTAGLAAKCAQIRREFRADFHCRDRGCSPWGWLALKRSCRWGTTTLCPQQWRRAAWETANNRILSPASTFRYHLTFSAVVRCVFIGRFSIANLFIFVQVAAITVTFILQTRRAWKKANR